MLDVQMAIARDEISNKGNDELRAIFQNSLAFMLRSKLRLPFETYEQADAYNRVSRQILLNRGIKSWDLYK